MAENEISDYFETDLSNVDISGITVQENVMKPSNVNNAFRALQGALARWYGDDTLVAAATTSFGSVPGQYIVITGSTGITAGGTIKAGTVKFLKFTGAPLLTHNATSFILPSGANIQAAAGDAAVFVSEGSGNWRCIAYQRASGADLKTSIKGADIASATTTDIGAATGDFVDVTGTTTITGLGTIAAGVERTVRFTGILTLTYNATSLILYSKTNITTYDGLVMRFRSLGSGNWIEVSQTPAVVTFTPTPNFGGGVVGIAGTFTGQYTRHCNSVRGTMYLAFSNKGSSVGEFACGGFAPVAKASPGFWPGTVALTSGFASMLDHTTTWVVAGQNAVRLGTSTATAATTFNLANTNFTNSTTVAISFAFECDP